MTAMPFSSPERARAAIRQLTPVPAHDIAELGRGADSVAYLVDGEWVFRFPAAADAQATLGRELALLPALQGVLPLAIPVVEHVGRRDEQIVFAAYRTVPGAPLTAASFNALPTRAQDAALAELAGFLDALHAFPAHTARQAGVTEQLLAGAYHPAQRDLPGRLGDLMPAADIACLDDIFARYEREHPPERARLALLHSDLKPEHVLYDSVTQRVTGVLDWGDIALGDPDFDLAVIAMFFGHEFLARLLGHLPDRDPDAIFAKARFFTTVRWLQDVVFDVGRDGPDAAEPSIARLHDHLATAYRS
jgi:aminoglycoside 2''-phosphotransferase